MPNPVGGTTTISRARPAQDRSPQKVAQIHLVYPANQRRVIPLTRPRHLVGRSDEGPSTLVVEHPTVSRKHLRIDWSSDTQGHLATDLSSRNGSWLNGRTLFPDQPTPLRPGTVLRLGDLCFVYESGDAPDTVRSGLPSWDALLGHALETQHLRVQLALAAKDPSPVLLSGATGSGKESISREIHRLSGRSGPLVAVNCAALQPQLFESQLFGHAKGAFTGATHAEKGMFRAAHQGSLFLDELGEMPLSLQPKLLRALEEGAVVPVGRTDPIPVDVRLIAATNRELEHDVEQGLFRRDLFARLAFWRIHLPDLSARRADVLLWVERLHKDFLIARKKSHPNKPLEFTPDAAERLFLHRWQENLRAINRFVHEVASRNSKQPLELHDLPKWVDAPSTPADKEGPTPKTPVPAPTSKESFVAVLDEVDWNVCAAARAFGRDRRQIYRWIKKYALERPTE